MAGNLTLTRRGKAISQAEAEDAPIVVVGPRLPDPASGYVLDTDDELQGWAREIGISEIVDRLDEAAEKGREQETRADLESLEAWQKRRVDRIISDMNQLARNYDLPVDSPDLLRKATVEAHPLMGSVFDSYILFDSNSCGGSFIPLVGAMPRFGWFGFNNKASSANGLGGATLFSRYWFKGKKAYLIDIGSCLNLADLAFDNMASSGVAF
jgi:hypothetical protein